MRDERNIGSPFPFHVDVRTECVMHIMGPQCTARKQQLLRCNLSPIASTSTVYYRCLTCLAAWEV